MKRHVDWLTTGFERVPAASAMGPFPRRDFLRVVTGDACEIFENEDGLVALAIADGVVAFAGNPDLTDYHAPLGTDPSGLMGAVVEALGSGYRYEFDSMPLEVAEPVAKGLEAAGLTTTTEQHEVAAVLHLPDTFAGYLEMIGKKQRHEVRRKHRRYEEHLGDVIFESHADHGWGFAEFVRLHRLADGDKGTFMTEENEAFFSALLDCPGWRIDLLRVPDQDRASACLFVYVDDEGYFLYNSSYDLSMAEASPGVAILAAGIDRAIGEGSPRFDFLKGDEVYKFRLGAEERPLYRVTARSSGGARSTGGAR